ncbi:MAG: hypothetical protein LBU75_13640 [Desulfovibrio sp.]|jgi:hypothetical protein|nr:hypothetical protein [Desulfovibrio sp.]
MTFKSVRLLALSLMLALGALPALAAEAPRKWELVNPTGVIEKAVIAPAARLSSLEGKTVVLRWNSKNNGNVFLDRLAELMAQRLPKTTVIKSYERDTTLNIISGTVETSQKITSALQAMKPDLIIAAQAD